MHFSFFSPFCSYLVHFYQTRFNVTDSCLNFADSADESVFLHLSFHIFISSISIFLFLKKFSIWPCRLFTFSTGIFNVLVTHIWGLPWWLSGKASAFNARDTGSISGSGRSPGEGNGNPLQSSCLDNLMDGGLCLVGCGLSGLKSQTWLSEHEHRYFSVPLLGHLCIWISSLLCILLLHFFLHFVCIRLLFDWMLNFISRGWDR